MVRTLPACSRNPAMLIHSSSRHPQKHVAGRVPGQPCRPGQACWQREQCQHARSGRAEREHLLAGGEGLDGQDARVGRHHGAVDLRHAVHVLGRVLQHPAPSPWVGRQQHCVIRLLQVVHTVMLQRADLAAGSSSAAGPVQLMLLKARALQFLALSLCCTCTGADSRQIWRMLGGWGAPSSHRLYFAAAAWMSRSWMAHGAQRKAAMPTAQLRLPMLRCQQVSERPGSPEPAVRVLCGIDWHALEASPADGEDQRVTSLQDLCMPPMHQVEA